MLKISTYSLGQLHTNCYLVTDTQTQETLIIDPADDGQYIIQKIKQQQFKPVAIIATHGHFDHNLATLEIKLTLNIPFFIHSQDVPLLNRMQSNAKHWLGINVDPPAEPDGFLDQNWEKLIPKLNNLYLKPKILHTPGHTPGSVCLYFPKEKAMFTGDTIFAQGSVGRTDFSYSSEPDLINSIQTIFTYPEDTTIYPGHGTTSTIKEEKKHHRELFC